MNPEEEEEQEGGGQSQMQADVTDAEMALRCGLATVSGSWADRSPAFFCSRYETLIGSIKKKFAKKRQRASEAEEDQNQNQKVESDLKRVFLKPQD